MDGSLLDSLNEQFGSWSTISSQVPDLTATPKTDLRAPFQPDTAGSPKLPLLVTKSRYPGSAYQSEPGSNHAEPAETEEQPSMLIHSLKRDKDNFKIKSSSGSSSATGSQLMRGQITRDFKASNQEEVTVNANDEVAVIDTRNVGRWAVRNLKTGKEGLVPSTLVKLAESVQVQDTTSMAEAPRSAI